MKNHDPYKIWETSKKISIKSNSLDLKTLIILAILAPNSHNTQPWKFKIVDDKIRIYPDLERSLRYGDRANREMYISLGCAIANIIIGANEYSYKTKIQLLPEELDNCAAILSFKKSSKSKSYSELFQQITNRVTNRFPHKLKSVPIEVINEILSLGKIYGPDVKIINDIPTKNDICRLTFKIGKEIYSDKIFKRELSHWISGSNSNRPDGMPLFDMEVPGPLSSFAPTILNLIPAILMAKREEKLMASAPAFISFIGQNDNKFEWLNTGISFQLIGLLGQKYGLSFCPWGGFGEHPTGNSEIGKLLKANGRVLFFARFGFPQKDQPHSPRRPIDEVIV